VGLHDSETLEEAQRPRSVSGGKAIKQMRPKYNIYDNNCQIFTLNLLDLICLPGRKKVTLSNTILSGEKRDPSNGEEDEEMEVAEPVTEETKNEMVEGAKKIMEDETPPMD